MPWVALANAVFAPEVSNLEFFRHKKWGQDLEVALSFQAALRDHPCAIFLQHFCVFCPNVCSQTS